MSHVRPLRGRARLALATAALLLAGLPAAAHAAVLPPVGGDSAPGVDSEVGITRGEVIPYPAGDVDGDGLADFSTPPSPATSGPYETPKTAQHISFGRADRLARTIDTEARWTILHPLPVYTPVPIGDFNGDGRDDVFVAGASGESNSTAPVRSAIVFGPARPGATTTLPSDTESVRIEDSTHPGWFAQLRGVGDLDNDGYDDVAATISNSRVVIAYGGPTRTGDVIDLAAGDTRTSTVDIKPHPLQSSPDGLARLGDVNGDGYDDLGFTHYEVRGSQWVYVVLGAASRSNLELYGANKTARTWRAGPNDRVDGFQGNASLIPVGDFDGDGLDDFAVNGTSTSMTIIRGRKTVREVTTAQETPKFNWVLRAPSVVPLGDLNGDGLADIAGSTSRFVNTQPGTPTIGGVVVFGTKSRSTININETGNTTAGFRSGGIPLGDVDGDGHPDLGRAGGIVYGYGPNTQPGPNTPPTINLTVGATEAYTVGTCSIFRTKYIGVPYANFSASEAVTLTLTSTQPGQATRTATFTPDTRNGGLPIPSKLISGALGTVTITAVGTDSLGAKSQPVTFSVPVVKGTHIGNINFGLGCPKQF